MVPHLGDNDFSCCADEVLSFLGEFGRDEAALDRLLLPDEEVLSVLAKIIHKIAN